MLYILNYNPFTILSIYPFHYQIKSIINIDLPCPVTRVARGTASLGAFCGCLDYRYLSAEEVDQLKATS